MPQNFYRSLAYNGTTIEFCNGNSASHAICIGIKRGPFQKFKVKFPALQLNDATLLIAFGS